MTENARDTPNELTAPPRMPPLAKPRFETPLVPRNSIAGRALVAVVAIMTFLASLTTGAVMLVAASASEWQADVAREVTIQVIPASGRNVDDTVAKAAALARGFPGIGDVRPYSKEESAKLLEPWLGQGLTLDELPVPRLIVVKIGPGAAPDISQLRRELLQQVPGATLDDHRGWIDRMRAMASTAVAVGIGVLILVIAATMLSTSRPGAGMTWIVTSREISDCHSPAARLTSIAAPVVSDARKVIIATTATSARPEMELRGTNGVSK